MDIYKKMYFSLFNDVSDIIELGNAAKMKAALKHAQRKTEEMYVLAEDEDQPDTASEVQFLFSNFFNKNDIDKNN